MIIMYHHVSPLSVLSTLTKKERVDEGWSFNITPENLEFQIQFFLERHYKFVHPDVYIDHIKTEGVAHAKHLLFTFDDGWIDNYTYAYPILKKYQIPAIFFVNSFYFDSDAKNKRRISLDHIKELVANNIVIGAHTVSHKTLTALTETEAKWELFQNKKDIEQVIGENVNYLAYPGGAFNSAISNLAKEIGFKAAFSVLSPHQNTKNDLFWLYRNVFSDQLNTWPDRYRRSAFLTKLFSFRVKRKLQALLKN